VFFFFIFGSGTGLTFKNRLQGTTISVLRLKNRVPTAEEKGSILILAITAAIIDLKVRHWRK